MTSLAWVLMDKSVKKLLARENPRGAGSSLVLAGWLFRCFQGNFGLLYLGTPEPKLPDVFSYANVLLFRMEQHPQTNIQS